MKKIQLQIGYEDKLDERFIDEQLANVLDAPAGSTPKEPAQIA